MNDYLDNTGIADITEWVNHALNPDVTQNLQSIRGKRITLPVSSQWSQNVSNRILPMAQSSGMAINNGYQQSPRITIAGTTTSVSNLDANVERIRRLLTEERRPSTSNKGVGSGSLPSGQAVQHFQTQSTSLVNSGLSPISNIDSVSPVGLMEHQSHGTAPTALSSRAITVELIGLWMACTIFLREAFVTATPRSDFSLDSFIGQFISYVGLSIEPAMVYPVMGAVVHFFETLLLKLKFSNPTPKPYAQIVCWPKARAEGFLQQMTNVHFQTTDQTPQVDLLQIGIIIGERMLKQQGLTGSIIVKRITPRLKLIAPTTLIEEIVKTSIELSKSLARTVLRESTSAFLQDRAGDNDCYHIDPQLLQTWNNWSYV